MRDLEYKNGNASITIKPTSDGLPTIFDKDVLLYCGSLLMQEANQGRIPPKTLRISSHDLLVSTNRATNNRGYNLLKKAFARLAGVRIQTNIKTNRCEQFSDFGLIESYRIIESSRVKKRMVKLEVTVSDWFYNSIVGNEVLTINRDYFRLGKPMERRLYEIARKHCGKQKSWTIGLIKLKEKTGSTSSLPLFRSRLKEIAKDNHLPDYTLCVDDNDKVTFTNRNAVTNEATNLPLFDDAPHVSVSTETLEKARKIVEKAETGWDFNALHGQFSEQIISGKFTPANANGAFINFVKKKVRKHP